MEEDEYSNRSRFKCATEIFGFVCLLIQQTTLGISTMRTNKKVFSSASEINKTI